MLRVLWQIRRGIHETQIVGLEVGHWLIEAVAVGRERSGRWAWSGGFTRPSLTRKWKNQKRRTNFLNHFFFRFLIGFLWWQKFALVVTWWWRGDSWSLYFVYVKVFEKKWSHRIITDKFDSLDFFSVFSICNLKRRAKAKLYAKTAILSHFLKRLLDKAAI